MKRCSHASIHLTKSDYEEIIELLRQHLRNCYIDKRSYRKAWCLTFLKDCLGIDSEEANDILEEELNNFDRKLFESFKYQHDVKRGEEND